MNIEFLRTSRKSYMIVKNADYIFENYELQMILHNDIPSLLEIQVIMEDGEAEYWYDVTGMQSLEKQFSVVPVGEKQLRFLLQNLIELKRSMEEFLLDDLNICFSASMVYYDRFTDKIRFCYIPGLVQQGGGNVKDLFEAVLQYLDHSDVMAVRMGYDMYERCTQSEFIVEDCIECLTNHVTCENDGMQSGSDLGGAEALSGYEAEKSFENRYYGENTLFRNGADLAEEKDTELEFLRSDAEKRKGHRRKRKRDRRKNIVDYSEILDEEQRKFYAAEEIQGKDYTECFSEENTETQWELIYKGDGMEQDLRLTAFPYLVGTDKETVQGALVSRTVSRIHAKLYMEEDRLYVEDYNSTNGTYVNRRLLPMNTPAELHPGDRVVFATEEYVVHCRRIPKRD